ncbi:MAG: LysM peptidoglycan-binding domain-containing protein [Bdellovibrionaceae bacterium]|nr:LysM peptidoglycan-binding domain-containing protein [Pseudobdellovibrionaceae bacterium]
MKQKFNLKNPVLIAIKKTGLWSLIVVYLSACSHFSKNNDVATVGNSSDLKEQKLSLNKDVSTSDVKKELPSFHLDEDVSSSAVVTELETTPTEVNSMVEKWISYFQNRGRAHMERYLARSTRYEKLMKKVLRDNGLPEDLFYIALIESGFTSSATSHASAVGYWQFIRGTGKRYGLEINKFVDERRDPVVATQAAADYFKELYSMFGSWYLAMASYNVGEGKVKRETIKNDTRDFWEIAKKKRLPKETINYIPKYIAAKLIAKNPDKYGFDGIDYLPPIEFDTMAFDSPVNLRTMADKMNYNYEDFKALNPKFKGEVAPLSNNKLALRIPVGMLETAKTAALEAKVDKVEFIADSGATQIYKIRGGESLYTIAKRFRTTVAYLRDLNDLPRKKRLRAGTKIYVPDRTPQKERTKIAAVVTPKSTVAETATSTTGPGLSSSEASIKENKSSEVISEGVTKYYIVQNGDSLFSIAQKYNTTVGELKKINQIKRGKSLRAGVKLKLPSDEVEKGNKVPDESAKNTTGSSQKKVKTTRFHIVKRGDSLKKISMKYDINLSKLKKINRLDKSAKLIVGQRITL